MIWPLRKKTVKEQYEWLLKHYAYPDAKLKESLDTLLKMQMLYRRIVMERRLLERDLEAAREYGIKTDWVKTPAQKLTLEKH